MTVLAYAFDDHDDGDGDDYKELNQHYIIMKTVPDDYI